MAVGSLVAVGTQILVGIATYLMKNPDVVMKGFSTVLEFATGQGRPEMTREQRDQIWDRNATLISGKTSEQDKVLHRRRERDIMLSGMDVRGTADKVAKVSKTNNRPTRAIGSSENTVTTRHRERIPGVDVGKPPKKGMGPEI